MRRIPTCSGRVCAECSGCSNAEHEETAPDAETPIISKLSCSLNGLTQPISIVENTIGYNAYKKKTASEQFLCNYGVNPKYQDEMIRNPLRVSAVGPDGEVRMIELSGHPFYVATLFVPQMISTEERSASADYRLCRSSSCFS